MRMVCQKCGRFSKHVLGTRIRLSPGVVVQTKHPGAHCVLCLEETARKAFHVLAKKREAV